MKRRTFVKKMMGNGISRNVANGLCMIKYLAELNARHIKSNSYIQKELEKICFDSFEIMLGILAMCRKEADI